MGTALSKVISNTRQHVEARRVYYVIRQQAFEDYVATLADVMFFEHVEVRVLSEGYIFNTCMVCIVNDAVVRGHELYGANVDYPSLSCPSGAFGAEPPELFLRFFTHLDFWYITMCHELSWNIIGDTKWNL